MEYSAIPYKRNGRDYLGCDCYGIVMLYYKKEFGIDIDDYRISPEGISDDFIDIDTSSLRKGDLIMIVDNNGILNHCGIMVDDKHIMQMMSSIGCTVIKLNRIINNVLSAHRHKGLI